MIINVLGLSRKSTARQLSKFFQAHGKIKSCDIVKDQISGESKGFGFVEMFNDDEAKTTIEKLNGATFDGRKIRVKEYFKK
jgi:cold-inducible RNA-binding protein